MNLFIYLFLAIVSLLKSPSISAEELECNLPKYFHTTLEGNKRVLVYEPSLRLNYNENDVAIYDYADNDDVNFHFHNSKVSFSGVIDVDKNVLYDSTLGNPRVFHLDVIGSARLSKNNINGTNATSCNLYLQRTDKVPNLNLRDVVELQLVDQLSYCVQSVVCKKVHTIINNVESFNDVNDNFKVLPKNYFQSLKNNLNEENPPLNCNNTDSSEADLLFQSALNAVVDVGILQVVNKVREMNNGTMPIPDLNEKFKLIGTGEFDAYNGTFRDLTTLVRTQNAVFTKDGLNLIASCGFGLGVANLQYQQYKLKYGFTVRGNLSANVAGGALNISVGVDYNQSPCKVVLQKLEVTQLGNLDIKLTGLGGLSKLTSKLITWITEKWKDQIIEEIEDQLREVIDEHIQTLDCEKYRDVIAKEFKHLPNVHQLVKNFV